MKTILMGTAPMQMSLYADSAVGRDSQPLFIPEIGGEWRLAIVPAFRIGRLGKSIPQKFAYRYIDAVSMVALLHPADTVIAPGSVPGWLSTMDSAVTTGRWLPTENATEEQANALACASAMATLKTGDVIIPACAQPQTYALAPDMIITAVLNGEEVLHIKVK